MTFFATKFLDFTSGFPFKIVLLRKDHIRWILCIYSKSISMYLYHTLKMLKRYEEKNALQNNNKIRSMLEKNFAIL